MLQKKIVLQDFYSISTMANHSGKLLNVRSEFIKNILLNGKNFRSTECQKIFPGIVLLINMPSFTKNFWQNHNLHQNNPFNQKRSGLYVRSAFFRIFFFKDD